MMFGFATPGAAAESAPSSEKLLCSFVEKMVTAGAFHNVTPGSSNSGAKPTFSDNELDYVQTMMPNDALPIVLASIRMPLGGLFH